MTRLKRLLVAWLSGPELKAQREAIADLTRENRALKADVRRLVLGEREKIERAIAQQVDVINAYQFELGRLKMTPDESSYRLQNTVLVPFRTLPAESVKPRAFYTIGQEPGRDVYAWMDPFQDVA